MMTRRRNEEPQVSPKYPGVRTATDGSEAANRAVASVDAHFVAAPRASWSFDLQNPDAGTYPVAADLDRDGRLELIVGDITATIY